MRETAFHRYQLKCTWLSGINERMEMHCGYTKTQYFTYLEALEIRGHKFENLQKNQHVKIPPENTYRYLSISY
ncbi:hypothetical protein X777_04266 [Ooceraea biroi]|uniref:Uncharacterized protein n=1 Tax=Ooceraea biroi TaxID=2015173 RepID=A0A026WHD4_OOCBI|nr:hypothetical protein X777_04266 [Ooceraea biroi]